MNANELAEKLITTLAVLPAVIEDWGICATPYEQKKHNLGGDIAMAKNAVDEVATMLRQQQAEIEALKAEKIRAYDNGVEDGKKSNTNPAKEQYKFGVDWSKDGNAVTVLKICEDGVAEVVFMDYQEVLNVPVKTLTDELELLETEIFVKDAIIKCYKEALEQIATGELTNEPNNYKDTVYVMRQIALNALAILRKAQEK